MTQKFSPTQNVLYAKLPSICFERNWYLNSNASRYGLYNEAN